MEKELFRKIYPISVRRATLCLSRHDLLPLWTPTQRQSCSLGRCGLSLSPNLGGFLFPLTPTLGFSLSPNFYSRVWFVLRKGRPLHFSSLPNLSCRSFIPCKHGWEAWGCFLLPTAILQGRSSIWGQEYRVLFTTSPAHTLGEIAIQERPSKTVATIPTQHPTHRAGLSMRESGCYSPPLPLHPTQL